MTIAVFGLRIRQARLLRNLTGKALVGTLGWEATRLTRLERREAATLSASDLQTLAAALRFPEGFFTSRPTTYLTATDLSYSGPSTTSNAQKSRTTQLFALTGDLLTELHTHRPLPPVQIAPARSECDPVTAAAMTRVRLGIRSGQPVTNLLATMERCGVTVVMRQGRFGDRPISTSPRAPGERHTGSSTWVGRTKNLPIVMLRDVPSWERTRWALAHELGHLVLTRAGAQRCPDHEQHVDTFAAELLAPISAVAPTVPPSPSLAELTKIKRRWGISIAALSKHLRDIQVISDHDYGSLHNALHTRINPATGSTWGHHEPGWRDREPERPRLLGSLLKEASETGAVDSLVRTWPAELLAELTAGQQTTGGQEPS
ncbi:hypothetical protein B7435_16850 [Mycolicibacterium peregrinum]|uniref:HTH cro/C1-type domain-containing protein n=1 Tax=Mycolicibacterium alvei TaxID=67081 RepID=A0A6N4V1J3_9MYCO|nr:MULTISPECIES: ImmA/IrrE family metallo-endopeptidase [Mycolicibacterium]MCV7003585.1 ImmA/IrrE family metallo-endopeptidase [Mycolicibacterium alvei]OWM01231.1 hypothetical protein B7435_16850 [Mycolicibacterium peregrinum]BBX30458.1 hypothetical protein MALV_55830 [Mycolicibacterium alvei]